MLFILTFNFGCDLLVKRNKIKFLTYSLLSTCLGMYEHWVITSPNGLCPLMSWTVLFYLAKILKQVLGLSHTR